MPINLLHKKTMFAMLFIWRQFCISVLLHSATAVILAMEQKNRDPLIKHIYCWSLNYLCAPSLPLCWLWKWKRKNYPFVHLSQLFQKTNDALHPWIGLYLEMSVLVVCCLVFFSLICEILEIQNQNIYNLLRFYRPHKKNIR